jgi:tRNA threonylcarbamoyladenosine biosynthesis protein TsaB
VLILALDTSTRAGSAAVVRDTAILSLVAGDATRTHAERLPDELQRALTLAGVAAAEITLLAVAAGPGGFTGLRIGLAAMQGLSMTLGKPVVGVSSLEALALAARLPETGTLEPGTGSPEPTIGCWIDAQRGEVFTALYARNLTAIDPPAVAAPQAVLDRWRALIGAPEFARLVLIGDGAARYEGLLQEAGVAVVPLPDLAPHVARIAAARAAAGQAGPPHALAPLYVRRPDAEIDRDRRGPR